MLAPNDTAFTVRGDYQQYDLGPDGAVTWCGDRMDAKLAALHATGLAPDFLAGESVLDVGCDHGFWSFMASSAGARSVLGLDRNRDVKSRGRVDLIAQNTSIARTFHRHDRVQFQAVNLGRQWREFGMFDVVFAMSVLHHVYAQCGDHNAVWFWVARHVRPGGLVIWEGPVDTSDPVIQANVPVMLQPGYTREGLRAAVQRYFTIERVAPALHETTREVWLLRRTDHQTATDIVDYEMTDGAGGASKAFERNDGARMTEIEQALGVKTVPGSLNLMVQKPFDWDRNYYRVPLLDSTDRRDPAASWAPRWCRFYPVAVGGVGGWAMRFEGETYQDTFIEVIGPHRFRDLVSGDRFVAHGGFLWPASGSIPARIILDEVKVLDQVMAHIPKRGVCVQAGCNVGVYPAALAEHFKTVLTFEPDADNYACAAHNLARFRNVVVHRAALGEALLSASLTRTPRNTGAHYLDNGPGDVEVKPIDGLGLEALDFLCLDVEGCELYVLKGAAETIAKFRPVILFEDKGMSERYGIAQGAAQDWLAETFGYRKIGFAKNDILMGPT